MADFQNIYYQSPDGLRLYARDYAHASPRATILAAKLIAQGDLTFDHVLPRARGGITSWENVVAACSKCNLRKGSKLLKQSGMTLRKPPVKPESEQLRNMGRKFPPNHLHESWMDFLYWDAELEE